MTTKDDARRYLGNVSPEQSFWVSNGHVLKNLSELANALQDIRGDVYIYHANKDKNDFSKWIEEVIGDKVLANELLSSRNKESAFKKIKNRISILKKKAVL